MRLRTAAVAVVPSIVVLALWIGAVVVPGGASSSDLEDRLAASDAELAQLSTDLETSRAVNMETVRMNIELEALGEAVPASADVAGFVRMVDRLATTTNVSVSSVTPQASEPSSAVSGTEFMQVTMSLEGEYGQVMDFIDSLLTSERLVEVISVDLASDSATASVFVDLVVGAYFEPDGRVSVEYLFDDAEQQVVDATDSLTLEASP